MQNLGKTRELAETTADFYFDAEAPVIDSTNSNSSVKFDTSVKSHNLDRLTNKYTCKGPLAKKSAIIKCQVKYESVLL